MRAKLFYSTAVLLFMLFVACIFACKPYKDLGRVNYSDRYKPVQSFLFVHSAVIHSKNDSSVLVLEIPIAQNGFQYDTVHFSIKYLLFENLSSLTAFDSLQTQINCNTAQGYYHLEIPIKIKMNSSSFMYLYVNENSSLKHFETFFRINKNSNSPGFLYPVRVTTNEKYISSYVNGNQVLKMNNSFGADTFRVWYYNYQFQLATPTFFNFIPVKFPERVDTVFVFTDSDTFRFRKAGLYVFHSTTHPDLIYSLLCAHESYPFITEPIQMAKPLRYISKNEEYEYFTEKNIKDRVDSFWIDKGGSTEHAKDMIRRYYNRVQFANEFFTSYQEGWQTDRGLVYIIFGPPDEVYYDEDAEWWGYHSRGNRSSVRYKFVETENPFGIKSYSLLRNQNYFDSWNRQGYAWRHGLAD